MEEIALAPALWMWDYLRRSSARGFFLPVTPGVESSSVAAIVRSMAELVFESIEAGNKTVLADLRRVIRQPDFMPSTSKDVVNELLVTAYIGMKDASEDSQEITQRLVTEISSHHFDIDIDEVFESITSVFKKFTKKEPKLRALGGTTD